MMCHYISGANFLRFSLGPASVHSVKMLAPNHYYMTNVTQGHSEHTLGTPRAHFGITPGTLGPSLGTLCAHAWQTLGTLREHTQRTHVRVDLRP